MLSLIIIQSLDTRSVKNQKIIHSSVNIKTDVETLSTEQIFFVLDGLQLIK